MKDADEALSKIALISIDEPSGVTTRTRQVMSNERDVNPMAAFKVTGLATGAVVGPPVYEGETLTSTCSNVWCGFRHFLQRWRDLHCLTKCPGHKQFMQMLFAFRMETNLSCDRDLNLGQAYIEYLSLHTMQLLTESVVVVVKDATGLIGFLQP